MFTAHAQSLQGDENGLWNGEKRDVVSKVEMLLLGTDDKRLRQSNMKIDRDKGLGTEEKYPECKIDSTK